MAKIKSDMASENRKCGVLLHPTSFPSPFGIGDLGIEARQTLLQLASAKVHLWQVLPLGPTGYGDSPYAARSTFAGNELLIDLRSLCDLGVPKHYSDELSQTTGRVDYSSVYGRKMVLLKEAAQLFVDSSCPKKAYNDFCKANAWWLDDYALYQSIVMLKNESRWFVWEDGLKKREKKTLDKYKKELSREIEQYKVLQYFFFTQWDSLHKFANDNGIQIIGDIPIYVAADSVDAWTAWDLFEIDENGDQTGLAGCPPDAFSATGQLWGNPTYKWENHKKDDYKWWKRRIEMTLRMVDIVRIDHFRGFESYWRVPAGESTAENGAWLPGPGMDLLRHFKGKNLIAEDLGVITDEVKAMKAKSGFPGMKVLQFAFENRDGAFNTQNAALPHNYESRNCVAYTGTHDNQTSRGWYNCQDPYFKDLVRRYLQCPDEEVVWQMIRSLLSSIADTVIIPMQDIMGLDDSARMNQPSTVGSSNWSWRYDPELMQSWMLGRLREMIEIYGRA